MNAGLLLGRMVVGTLLATHGIQRLCGGSYDRGQSGTAIFFESIGCRPGQTLDVSEGATEFAAGFLLALGLFTPLAASIIVCVTVVGICTAQWTAAVLLAAFSVLVALTGPGVYSIDNAFGLTEWWTSERIAALLFIGVSSAGAALALRERIHVT